MRSPHVQAAGVSGHHGDDEGMYSCIILDEFHKYFSSMLQVLASVNLLGIPIKFMIKGVPTHSRNSYNDIYVYNLRTNNYILGFHNLSFVHITFSVQES